MSKIEIKLCSTCNGLGAVRKEELVCYHKGEYDVWFEECPICQGAGRVKVTTVETITIEPYEFNTMNLGKLGRLN